MSALQRKRQDEAFARAVLELPTLPSFVNYEDDYDEEIRTVKVADCETSLPLHISGEVLKLNFQNLDDRIRPLVRFFTFASLQRMTANSVRHFFGVLARMDVNDLLVASIAEPAEMKQLWNKLCSTNTPRDLVSLKIYLSFLCEIRFMHWTPGHSEFVSRALSVGTIDTYATVRSGDAFLTAEEEATLVRWIDDSAISAKSLDKLGTEIACLLVASYQFGMRPKQLGMIRKRDCTIRISKHDNSVIAHLVFKMIKQRDTAMAGLTLTRKVKREWAPLYEQLMKHKRDDSNDSFLFGFSSRYELGSTLSSKLTEILQSKTKRVAYDLRHSMAQRLVDAGATHEEVAFALGHARLESGLVYFRASSSQAELVNKAMGISSTYKAVGKIAASRFIDPNELARLKGDQQIAGVPHGIAISGIGGCESGQPACPYNPISSCYGCPKFMPVSDVELHRQVLKDFREVVGLFSNTARGDNQSPAYLQLQRTISDVQGVIAELVGADHD